MALPSAVSLPRISFNRSSFPRLLLSIPSHSGICIVYLLRGYNVILKEINDKLVLAGVERIVNDLTRVAKARKMPVIMVAGLMQNLTAQATYDGFDKVDLVVEAVLENLKLKQEIFQTLEKICPKHAILSTNTSTIDIAEIAKFTTCQDRVVGLHYFSPAHVMPLLEIIRVTNKVRPPHGMRVRRR